MAKGKAKHEARLQEISLLGKDLARRAKQRCELCGGKGDLRPYDADPNQAPTMSSIALFCADCRARAEGRDDPEAELRFLEGAIWSDIPAVGETARAMLGRVDAGWARAALEML